MAGEPSWAEAPAFGVLPRSPSSVNMSFLFGVDGELPDRLNRPIPVVWCSAKNVSCSDEEDEDDSIVTGRITGLNEGRDAWTLAGVPAALVAALSPAAPGERGIMRSRGGSAFPEPALASVSVAALRCSPMTRRRSTQASARSSESLTTPVTPRIISRLSVARARIRCAACFAEPAVGGTATGAPPAPAPELFCRECRGPGVPVGEVGREVSPVPLAFAHRALLRAEPRPRVGMGVGATFSRRAALAQACGR